ncbi:FecR family protein [Vreelandella zhanjiangensis]|uniref:FecR family protein n=1 Tax=Vreelandella zhanjiangensis TaxID=1121960 RepID=UPI00402A742E
MTKPNEPLSQPAPSPAIDDATMDDAIAWYLKIKDASVTQDEQQAFNTWLQQSTLHHFAYQEAEQLWQDIEAPTRLLALQHHAIQPKRRNKQPWGWAVAALFMLGLLLSFELWREPAHWDHLLAATMTDPGQTQHLQLTDGSTLLLDGNSALKIDFNQTRRGLTLRRGRLWIDVAKDVQRPFLINAGDISIHVVGTHFSVMRSGNQVTVTVAEGQVAVSDSTDRQAMLVGGQQITVQNGELGPISSIEHPLALAWREGQVVFDDAGISEIVAQLERMLPGRLLLDTQAFNDVRLSGSFPANQPTALLDTLTNIFDITVHHLPGNLVWLRAAHTG